MTTIEIKQDTAQKLEALSKQTDKSIDEVLEWLLSNVSDAVADDVSSTFDDEWTDEALDELLTPAKPLTGKQIVEKHLASGVIGSWSDMEIEDSVAWLEVQRAKRRKKSQW